MKKFLSWGDCIFFVAFWTLIMIYARWSLRASVGAAIAAIGFAFWITARLQLGDSFSLGAKAKTLVTTGLYSRFRHPIYLFGFLAYAGVLLIWGSWIAFFCFILLYSVEVVRVRKE